MSLKQLVSVSIANTSTKGWLVNKAVAVEQSSVLPDYYTWHLLKVFLTLFIEATTTVITESCEIRFEIGHLVFAWTRKKSFPFLNIMSARKSPKNSAFESFRSIKGQRVRVNATCRPYYPLKVITLMLCLNNFRFRKSLGSISSRFVSSRFLPPTMFVGKGINNRTPKTAGNRAW